MKDKYYFMDYIHLIDSPIITGICVDEVVLTHKLT